MCETFCEKKGFAVIPGMYLNNMAHGNNVKNNLPIFYYYYAALRIRDVYHGSKFFYPGSRVKKVSDPDPIFNPKNCF